MSPRAADPAVRTALIEAAARLVAEEGRTALTLRRLAREVGTSTMAVYTHFGSMDELRRAVREEGFARFRAHLDAVPATGDPLADLMMLGAAYFASAESSPDLYRAMFSDGPVEGEEPFVGLDTFVRLVDALARCVDSGVLTRPGPAGPDQMAVEVWAVTHGLVSLQLARLLPPEEARARLWSAAGSLLYAWGADPEVLARSYAATRPGAVRP